MVTSDDVGKLVSYYREGWYHGYIEHVTRKDKIKIRPIGPKGSNPHPITIEQSDIKQEEAHDITREITPKLRKLRKSIRGT